VKPLRASNLAQATPRLSWVIRNAASRVAEIDLFDIIGDPYEGTTAKDFVQELRGISAEQIILNINSPGGLVDDALAIYDAILRHPANVTAYISTARSAASFVAQAADHRVITKNGAIQIHDAHAFIGVIDSINADGIDHLVEDLQRARAALEEESNNIASIYSDRAGNGDIADWRSRMQANGSMGTAYRGQEAVDVGLADEVAKGSAKNSAAPMRVAAQADDEPPDPDLDEEIDLTELLEDLPSLVNGYEPPLIEDLSRLLEVNQLVAKGA
jgi:ATP-dependent protease ClpP protease subunit